MLDPQAEALRDLLLSMELPPLWTLPLEEARANALGLAALQGEPQPVAETRELIVPGPAGDLQVRVHIPDGAEGNPLLVYFHGGGWTIGSIDLLDRPVRAIANATRSAVASVEYRLAPESKFPAAVEDAYASTTWLADHAADFGADQSRVLVAGDSAGGNLAAVTAIQARDRKGPRLAGQLLYFAVTAAPEEYPSYAEAGDGYMLTASDMHWFWSQYTNGASDANDPRAAPIREEDLSGLPPALVTVAGYDPLRDEGLAYAERLKDAGVEVTVRNFEGQMHDFLWVMGSVDATQQLLADASDFVTAIKPQGG